MSWIGRTVTPGRLRSTISCDKPWCRSPASPDVRTDPARPGFALQRMWVVDSAPAKLVYETLHLPNVLIPPKNGSVLNVFTFPPDATWLGKVGQHEVAAYFQAMGATGASMARVQAAHGADGIHASAMAPNGASVRRVSAAEFMNPV